MYLQLISSPSAYLPWKDPRSLMLEKERGIKRIDCGSFRQTGATAQLR